MGQMARELSEGKKDEFPIQTVPNPGGHQQLKVVTILRNGKIIGTEEIAQASPDAASTSKEHETMALTKEISAVLLRKLPPKLKDLGSFTIPCKIGDHLFERALLDLGAGVNLFPFIVYEILCLGELQPTSITLQLVDISIKRLRRILQDVLVKVGKFILPADFIVLDMEESPMPLPLPIILGRPFIRIVDTKTCVKEGNVSMKVNCEKIKFKIFDALKLPQDNIESFNVYIIQGVVDKVFQASHIDPLKMCTSLRLLHHIQVSTLLPLRLLCLLILLLFLLLSRH
jgi:hypothetical protein